MIRIDYHGHPKKSLPELLWTYSKRVLILDDVLMDDDTFSYIYQDMLDILKWGLEMKYVREFPIHFALHHGDPTDIEGTHVLEVRHFLSNMVFWYAFMKMERVDIMTTRHIIDWKDKDIKFIAQYLNDEIIPLYDGNEFHEINAILDEISFNIKAISDAFCLIFGYSASIYDIMQAEKSDPEIHEIIYSPIDVNMPPKEIEERLHELNSRLMDCFGKADSDLRPLLKSGKNISADQFREIFLRIGFKSDIANRTIPYFIDHNLLITGIESPAAFYIDASSGRKASIDSKLAMSKPGAMSKKMNNNSTASFLDNSDQTVCNSARPIYYLIEDDQYLKMLDRRWYYGDDGEMRLLRYKRDKHLIGRKLGFRSPCTCMGKNGVCAACYGTLYNLNSDMASQGSYAATMISEPGGQLILKAKHVQSTDSAEVKFSEDFDRNFDMVSSEITASDDIDADLMIALGQVQVEETDDGDAYFVQSFDLVDYNGEVKAHIEEENQLNLYMAPAMVSAWRTMRDKPIPIAMFDDDDDSTVLFRVEVKSKAITQSIQLMIQALDSKDHLGFANDLDGLCQRFGRILLDAGIEYNFVHAEMVIRQLLRTRNSEFDFPDFGPNGDHNDYTILRLTSSLSKNPSPMIRMSTGWLKKSLISTALYKATKPSHLDAFFVPVLSDVIVQDGHNGKPIKHVLKDNDGNSVKAEPRLGFIDNSASDVDMFKELPLMEVN